MLKKRIVSCFIAVLVLVSCISCFTITALGSDTVEGLFNDTFDEGSDYTDNALYKSSSNVYIWKKASGLKDGIDGASVSALSVGTTTKQVGEVVYYAPKGIKSFQFDSRFSSGSVNTAWDETVHCNASFSGAGITSDQLSKSAVAYVSADGTAWLNPYDSSNDYTVDITYGTSTYDSWTHFLYKSINIPENIKYLKIAFPAMNFSGSSQIDNLSIVYNYDTTIQAENRTFTDDFNKGVTAETAVNTTATGEYYRTDELYYNSNNITGFVKTNSLKDTGPHYSEPYKYAALASSVTTDTTESAYITYYAPGGITEFNFVSRLNGSNTPTNYRWSDDKLTNISGDASDYNSRQPLVYVSADNTTWTQPSISYNWATDLSAYTSWSTFRCSSVSVADGVKYLKIVFPYGQWVGATQIDDLVIKYKYYPEDTKNFEITNQASSNDGNAYTYTANVKAGSALEAVMIVAYYNSDKLVGAAVTSPKNLAAGGTDTFTATAMVSDTPTSAKAFFWDSLTQLQPVTSAVPVSLN